MMASLPMYDWPELTAATDAWWQGLAGHLGVALQLDRTAPHTAAWRQPELLFSQTCGYPLTHEFKDLLEYVGTPHYAADGCKGPNYCSLILAREQRSLASFAGGVAAVNSGVSMSGMLALKLVFAPFARQGNFFSKAIETGGHVNSLAAVRAARADVCAIDSVCVELARRYRPDYLEGLVEIARSPEVPGLPYVTRGGNRAEIRRALAAAFADPQLRQPREQLLLTSFSVLGPQAYAVINELETEMERSGGLNLQ